MPGKFFISFLFCFLCAVSFAQKADRGYDLSAPPAVVAAKGAWMAGGNAGISSYKADNYDFLVINGINGSTFDVSVAPQFCYFFADNLGAGCKLGYSRSIFNLASADISAGDIGISFKNYYSITQKFSINPFFRYYLPLGASGRFSAFADAGIKAGFSQAKQVDAHSKQSNGAFSEKFIFSLGVDAGLVAMFTKHLAADVSLGLLSLDYTRRPQNFNQVENGFSEQRNFNFMINLLSISFGLYYYL